MAVAHSPLIPAKAGIQGSWLWVPAFAGTSGLIGLFLLRRDLLADRLVVIDRRALAEVLQLEELPDLDLAVLVVRVRAALHPLDRLGLVLHLDDPVAGDQLLGLGKRSIDHRALAALEADARSFRARLQPGAVEHDARLHQLFVELAHRAEHLLARHLAG